MIAVGTHNAITDVDGIRVGNCHDRAIRSGVTVILPDQPCIAAGDIRGGAPGTRETDLLDPANTVEKIDALVFSGGSAFGLDAASGATTWLARHGRGLAVRGVTIPIVSAAVIFDPPIGGPQDWHEAPPHREMAISACDRASVAVDQGNVGAGIGATAGPLKGGLGTASFVRDDGIQVGALAIANPFGSTVAPGTATFWAAPYEMDGEFGGQSTLGPISMEDISYDLMGEGGANTTLVAIATNLRLTRAQAKRIAIMAQDGLARAIRPVHTPFDGDSVFVLATGAHAAPTVTPQLLAAVGLLAADAAARAIAKGVYRAESLGDFPSYREKFKK